MQNKLIAVAELAAGYIEQRKYIHACNAVFAASCELHCTELDAEVLWEQFADIGVLPSESWKQFRDPSFHALKDPKQRVAYRVAKLLAWRDSLQASATSDCHIDTPFATFPKRDIGPFGVLLGESNAEAA